MKSLDERSNEGGHACRSSAAGGQSQRVYRCLLVLDSDGLQALEGGHVDVRHVGVQLLRRLLILVTLAVQADADAVGNVADTLAPQELVEQSVNAHVLSAHRLASEVADGLQSAGSALLEGDAMHALVHVDGVLAGHDGLAGRALLALLSGGLRLLLLLVVLAHGGDCCVTRG